MQKTILHSDMNGFYASVECIERPDLRNKPVAVGGDAEKRHGIILAKNEAAKKYKIKTGEALWQARQKCPWLIILPPDYSKYLHYAKLAREIYHSYTDQVEPFGLDEAWLDVSASKNLFGSGESIAEEIRLRIKKELHLTVSVGVSYNKIFAKLGSDMKKPDATTVITIRNYKELVWPLPVSDLLYVGRATTQKLMHYGVYTIGDLANTNPDFLRYRFGKIGVMLHQFANGEDQSVVSTSTKEAELKLIKSIGNSTTAPRDLVTEEDVKLTVWMLSESVAARMRDHGFLCRTVQVHFRENDLSVYERQALLPMPTQLASELATATMALYCANRPEKPLRSIGIRACNLLPQDRCIQLSLFPEDQKRQNRMILERTVDDIRRRFGYFSITHGMMMVDRQLTNLNPKEDHIIHPVGWFYSAQS